MENNFSNRINFKGPRGPVGDTGPIGPKGLKGDKGDKGPSGPPGPRGDKGDRGDRGPKGAKGDSGDRGPKGPRGLHGEKGEVGDTGIPGEKGDKGESGYNGKDGDRGPRGEKGEPGDKGFIGESGEAGSPGPKGDKGDKGDAGPRGDRGDIGLSGDKGDTGPPGFKGPRGPQGDKGPTGDAGDVGPSGEGGESGKMLPPSNEVIISRIAKDLINHNVEVYVDVKTSQNVVVPGVNRVQVKETILKANIAYIQFRQGTVVPIKNIESFNIILDKNNLNKQELVTNIIKDVFNEFYNCQNNREELIENWSYENEWFKADGVYIPICEYNVESNTCICKGQRVDTCRYLSSSGEALSRIVNKYKDQGKKVTEVFTTKRSIFSLGANKSGTIIDSIGGVMLMSYDISGVENFKCLAVVNLPNVVAMRII